MTWYPADSDEAREQRDRADNAGHAEHDCAGGWVGEDGAGRPRPCPICKPHVSRLRRRLRQLLGWRAP